MRATYPVHLALLHMIILLIYEEENMIKFLIIQFFQLSVATSILVPDILLTHYIPSVCVLYKMEYTKFYTHTKQQAKL